MSQYNHITENYREIRDTLPSDISIVVAAKNRSPAEVLAAVRAGADKIGENYVQEAESLKPILDAESDRKVEMHLIGHLQRNKVNKALGVCDTIQSIDSLKIARAVNKRLSSKAPPLPVLIQVNIAGEDSKYGIAQNELESLLLDIIELKNLQVKGLMTMEPFFAEPEKSRPYFVDMRKLFDKTSRMDIPGVDMEWLSMGMTNSYKVAVDEGANMVRIGTAIFGPREK